MSGTQYVMSLTVTPCREVTVILSMNILLSVQPMSADHPLMARIICSNRLCYCTPYDYGVDWEHFLTYLKSVTWFFYPHCKLRGSAIKINQVICKNSVWPCVKGHIAYCKFTGETLTILGLTWKCLFMPQDRSFWGIWPFKWGAIFTRPQKAHPCIIAHCI